MQTFTQDSGKGMNLAPIQSKFCNNDWVKATNCERRANGWL